MEKTIPHVLGNNVTRCMVLGAIRAGDKEAAAALLRGARQFCRARVPGPQGYGSSRTDCQQVT